ncbi:integrase core domain-containing protein [Rhodoferax sp.]|uniref:integrase core domain-containing protein n=1 Tax=Rhodoferax sp. TaxID=50421 RepID=UPI003A103572
MTERGMSQRRACVASGIARSTLRYCHKQSDDSGVIQFMQTYMATNPRHGFGLLYASALHQNHPWGKTVLWRVYCQLHLNLPRRGKKRLPARIPARVKGIALNHIQPGKPTQNAYVERFNRTYRTEVLDCYVFDSLQEVRDITEDWLHRYNHHRPHEALGSVPPVEYRVTKFPNLYF